MTNRALRPRPSRSRPDANSEIGQRVKASFDRFIDAPTQTDQAIAELIRGLEIDIVVDLNGFTRNSRLGVLARRPAPIQVNYLGYAGTMGADFYDYIVADATVIPREHADSTRKSRLAARYIHGE